jgi:hypothetical protein
VSATCAVSATRPPPFGWWWYFTPSISITGAAVKTWTSAFIRAFIVVSFLENWIRFHSIAINAVSLTNSQTEGDVSFLSEFFYLSFRTDPLKQEYLRMIVVARQFVLFNSASVFSGLLFENKSGTAEVTESKFRGASKFLISMRTI